MHAAPERIGPYPIEREIGRGGMGVVYLGRDPALGRPVAVKVLPLEMAADPQRLARFDREARMLAAVHHPNVASIFGVGEDDDGHRYLALEYVAGESLAERLDRSALPLSESLAVCSQLAAGLEAAHEAGVVHRDLKPGNVRITPDGVAKLLDFGLAKGAAASGSSAGSGGDSPTRVIAELSTEGAVLGTVTYMSPEQATGKAVDRRTDVWALGCILFECLAGRAPFDGNTSTDTMVKILEREPPWEQLPPETPPRIRDLLRRCLEKDRRRRLRDAGDARLELEAAHAERGSSSAVTVTLGAPRRRRLAFAAVVALVSALVAGLFGLWLGRREAAWPATPLHLEVAVPRTLRAVAWSLTRDGSSLLFWARPRAATTGALRVYRRRLDGPEVTEIPGTEGIDIQGLSRDGRWLYVARLSAGAPRLLRLPLDGSGPPLEIAEWDPSWVALVILDDGDVLTMVGNGSRMVRIDASTGRAGAPFAVDLDGSSWLRTSIGPPLPDGRVLFDAGKWSEQGLQVGTLLVDPAIGKSQRVLDVGEQARFVPPDRLLFARGAVLLGAPFDARAGRLTGEPVALTGDIFSISNADWDIGENGTLAYRPAGGATAERRLLAVTPGTEDAVPWNRERREYLYALGSRDGRWVYAGIFNARRLTEIWRLPRDGAGELLWSERQADTRWPVPSPDGRWLAFTRRGGDRRNGVYLLDLERRGEPRLLRASATIDKWLRPLAWLPDSSRLLVAQRQDSGNTVLEIDVAADPSAPPRVLVASFSDHAAVSPDGRWLAFDQVPPANPGVYLAPYRRSGALEPGRAISDADGSEPRWGPDGKTLYYAQGNDRLFAVPVRDGAATGEPRLAASIGDPQGFVTPWGNGFDVLPDGRLLFVQRSADEGELRDIELVLGFGRDLARRLRP